MIRFVRYHQNSLRYVGFCPVCERDIKVLRGTLVHHGYRRPGHGEIVGDCPGVGYQPFELSTDAAQAYRDGLLREGRDLERMLREAPSLTEITEYSRLRGSSIVYTRDDPSFPRRLEAYTRGLRMKQEHVSVEVARMDRLIADWKPKALTEVNEEQEHRTRETKRDERQAQLQSKREEARATAIERLKSRVDSAVRNQNLVALANIFEDGALGLAQKLRIRRAEALHLIDRDHVWSALKLLTAEGYVGLREPDGRRNRTLAALTDSAYRPMPWPPELGTPKRRRQ